MGRQQTVQSSVKVWREPPLGSSKTSLSSPQNAHAYVTTSFYAVSSSRGPAPLTSRSALSLFLVLALIGAVATAEASVGLTEISGKDGDGPVTIYYPSNSEAKAVTRGPFTLYVAVEGTAVRGNRRLIVLSHGSGGSPWVHSDLARTLVEDGFVVAMPEHRGDNYRDPSTPGPKSWARRPAEVSRAIDVVGQDARFQPLLALDKVGMYGMSAGGHTALSLAGGRWSPALLRRHCEAHLAEDFQSCVGLTTS